jgi:hypothetical protein
MSPPRYWPTGSPCIVVQVGTDARLLSPVEREAVSPVPNTAIRWSAPQTNDLDSLAGTRPAESA